MIPDLVIVSPEDLETATGEFFDALFGTGWRREVEEMLMETAAQRAAMRAAADEAFDSVATGD